MHTMGDQRFVNYITEFFVIYWEIKLRERLARICLTNTSELLLGISKDKVRKFFHVIISNLGSLMV